MQTAQEHPAVPGEHEEGLRWAEENAMVDDLPAFHEDVATVAWTKVNYAYNNGNFHGVFVDTAQ